MRSPRSNCWIACGRTRYAVDLSMDGEDGLRRGLAANYVVMTVDRIEPRIHGIEVIHRLREKGIATPALIPSAIGKVDDRVRGLRAGAAATTWSSRSPCRRWWRASRRLPGRSRTVVKHTILRGGRRQPSRCSHRDGRQLPRAQKRAPFSDSCSQYYAIKRGRVGTDCILMAANPTRSANNAGIPPLARS